MKQAPVATPVRPFGGRSAAEPDYVQGYESKAMKEALASKLKAVVRRMLSNMGMELRRLRKKEEIRSIVEMLDAVPVSIVVMDFKGVPLYANRNTFAMYGYENPHEFMALDLKRVNAPESALLIAERMRLVEEKGKACFEVVRYRKNKTTFPLEVNAKKIQWQGVPAIISIATDITERKNIEARLLEARKLESIGRLAGGVAHDFNNMLSVILGNTKMLLENGHPGISDRMSLERIEKAGLRCAALTNQLLGFARKQMVMPRVVDLNAAITGMIRMLRRIAGQDISLHWEPGPDLWPVRIDPSQIDQILSHLAANARDAITGDGNLIIRTANIFLAENDGTFPGDIFFGDYVLLTVSDDGCGMDRETLDYLFEPFFTTKDVGQGVGMGLSTVYGIVKQNDGFISVSSEPGRGATFHVYLPRQAGGAAPVTEDAALATPVSTEWETVLLVVNDPSILELCLMMLRRLGHPVLSAATPAEALDLAEEYTGEIHLLFCNAIIPDMNGRDLARRLRRRRPDMKCLLMSGYPKDIIAERGLLDKDIKFIQKPFGKQDLDAEIREMFNSRRFPLP